MTPADGYWRSSCSCSPAYKDEMGYQRAREDQICPHTGSVSCPLPLRAIAFAVRILPVAWNIQDSPFSRLRSSFFSFVYGFISFIWLHRLFSASYRLPLVATSRGYSAQRWVGFSLRWLPLLQSMGSRRKASVAVVHRLGRSSALGSSQIRDQTHVSCLASQILYHWATREVSHCPF